MGNKPSPYVLRALCILGPEEILKLAHVLNREEVTFKKASGDDVVVWKQEKVLPKKEDVGPRTESKVLQFSRPSPVIEEKQEKSAEGPSDDSQIMSSEVILIQREIARETSSEGHKAAAKSGYSRANEMYIVKSQSLDGKEKIRFASTNGVLIDKKQA